ncbi:MAG: hypothetical protein QGG01_02245, partial [Roseibacillus sp.]|nr:hypothetical protein [Roseibacillus sp.]
YCLGYCSRLLEVKWFQLMPYRQVGLMILMMIVAGVAATALQQLLPFENALVVAMTTTAMFLVFLGPPFFLLYRKDLKGYWDTVRHRLGGRGDGMAS